MGSWSDNNDRVEAQLQINAYHSGDRARLPCPFCEDAGHNDRKRSMSVSTATGSWHCFRCGTSGRLGGYADADDYFQHRGFRDDEDEEQATTRDLYDLPKDEFVPLAGNRSLVLKPARDYLRKRGIKEAVWQHFDLRACHEGFYHGRIVVPHYVDGALRGYVARLWKNPAPDAKLLAGVKYLYAKGMQRGEYLYNHKALSVETDKPLLVVEGAFDVFPFGKAGAAALFGDPTEDQVRALARAPRPVCIVLDGDAWQKGWALAARLRMERPDMRAGHVRLPPRIDPDEVDRDWLREEARRSITASL